MEAVLRVNTFDRDKLAESSRQLDDFDAIHAAQPGYLGGMSVDLGNGRFFVMNLWEDERQRQAGLETLAPAVERLVNPLLAKPSELIGVGPVVRSNLTPSGDAGS